MHYNFLEIIYLNFSEADHFILQKCLRDSGNEKDSNRYFVLEAFEKVQEFSIDTIQDKHVINPR